MEQVDLKQLKQLLQAEVNFGAKLEPDQKQIGDHGHIDLAQYLFVMTCDYE